jgi:hypothetical protein
VAISDETIRLLGFDLTARFCSRKDNGKSQVHQVVVPQVVYGNLLIWRELRQDSPIHAIGADIWDGEKRLVD